MGTEAATRERVGSGRSGRVAGALARRGGARWLAAPRSAVWIASLLLIGAAAVARAGESDRALEPTDRRDEPGAGEAPGDAASSPSPEPGSFDGVAAVHSGDLLNDPEPAPRRLRPPSFVPEPFDPHGFPEKDRLPEPAATAPAPPGIRLDLNGRLRALGGYDNNVFRSDRRRTGDGLFRTQGGIEALARFPGGGEIFAEAAADGSFYLERDQADEHFVSLFTEFFQPVTSWLDLGLQNTFEWSRLNLLDDNGDLFPRGRFGSFDDEVRGFVILRPQPTDPEGGVGWLRDLAFELGAGFRLKDYDENRGVDSLDYTEMRFDGSIGYTLARRPRSRFKLKYRFRRRSYDEFRARGREGVVVPGARTLDLHRHQLNLTWFQELRRDGFQGRVILGAGAVYNRDLHHNDRSYRELSLSLRGEWWPVPERTRLDLSVRGVGRDFLVRRPSNSSGSLRHRLFGVTVGVWQAIGKLGGHPDDDGAGSGAKGGVAFAFVASATATAWRSGDVQEDYDRYIVQAGLEASW